MEEVSHLIIKVTSDDVSTADKRMGSLSRASDGLTSLIKNLVTAAAALAIFKKVAGDIAEFERTMSAVRAVTQASKEDFELLSASARKLGAETRYSASQAAEGMKLLGQAGFNTAQIVAAMPGVLDLATAGELELANAADIASSALAGFRLKASESNRVADALAVSASASNTSVSEMGEALKYVAPIAASMNLQLEEVSATLGVLSNAGIKSSMAGTSLRQILSSLAAPTKEASDTLRAYGIKIDDVNPSVRSLTQVIEALKKGGLDAAGAFQIFGDRGAPAILALTTQVPALKDLNLQLVNSSGRAKEMSRVMGDNLTGDLKELQSSVEELALKMGDAGLKDVMRDVTKATTEFVREINAMVESGEAGAWVDVMKGKLGLLTDGFSNAAENIAQVWALTMEFIKGDGKEGADNIIDAFKNMPENIRAFVQMIGADLGRLVMITSTINEGIHDLWLKLWDFLIISAKNVGSEIVESFKVPFINLSIYFKKAQIELGELINKIRPGTYDDTFFAELRQDVEKYKASLAGVKNDFWEKEKAAAYGYKVTSKAVVDSVIQGVNDTIDSFWEEFDVIMAERAANIKASDDKLKKIEELRAAYAKLKADRAAAEKETAAKAGVPGKAPVPEVADPHFNVQEFDNLKKSLQLEEITIQESYERRLDLIRRNTKAGSNLRLSLEKELNQQYNIELEKAYTDRVDKVIQLEDEIDQAIAEGRTSKVEGLLLQMRKEEEEIKASYERRKTQILADTTITETERAKLIAELNAKQLQQQREIEMARNKLTLKHAADFFGNLSTIASAFGAKGSRIAKAAAITQTIIKTYESATSAYASLAGIPYIGPALGATAAAAAVAAGLANVQMIKSQNTSPAAYDAGGMIPSGQVGIVGEGTGPELVRGPAIVTSTRTTRDNKLAERGGNMVNFSLKIENNVGGTAEVREENTSDGKLVRVIINKVKQEIAADVDQGGNPITRNLEKRYRLNRGAAA